MSSARLLLALALALLLPGAQRSSARQEAPDAAELEGLLARLDAAGPEGDEAALEALLAAGEPAARRALEGWAAAPPAGRRARAQLVAEAGGVDCMGGALALLAAPAALTAGERFEIVRFLGRPALGTTELETRLEHLVAAARDDSSPGVRAAALAALGEIGAEGAIAGLDLLLGELPSPEAAAAARILAPLPAARARLAARVQAELAAAPGSAQLAPETLAVLLAAYGRVLAELTRGGETAAERAPLVLGRSHPSERVRRAAQTAQEALEARLVEFQEFARADRLLALLAADGLPRRDLLYRRAHLALAEAGDPDLCRRLAEALLASTAGEETAEGRTWRLYGLSLWAAALLAGGEVDAARKGFAAMEDLLRGLLAEREDLRPSLHRRADWPISPLGGSLLVERLLDRGLVELWLAVCDLVEGSGPGDPRVLSRLRTAHEARLRAQRVGIATDALFGASSLDDFLDRDLAPRRLLLGNPRLWGRAGERTGGEERRGLDLELALGRALATVSPRELPGFEPLAGGDPPTGDPLQDDVRFGLLLAIQDAEFDGAWRAWWAEEQALERRAAREDDPALADPEARRNSPAYWRVSAAGEARRLQDERLRRLAPEERRDPARRSEIYHELGRFQMPSTLALTLAGELRASGRAAEARDLSARALAGLRDAPAPSAAWTEWVSARLESAIGASYMDEDRPADAERSYLSAEERLAALENTLLGARAEAQGGRGAPGRAAGVESQLERTRTLRADVLLSLAVNANVRLGDPEKALGYFERAFALDRRDFMRGLLACYRARSGRDVEARSVLRRLHPAPDLYYNLACTYALLGEAEEALDWLQRDLEENHPTAGSRRRQQEWARSDPDLASLREDPRFARLVGE
ncbi:MAG: hypothetical protein AB1726_10860 [Planctomycetota bacterium]